MTNPSIPALPPAPLPARPRVTTIGTVLAAGAVVMMFAALLGIYTGVRSDEIASVTEETQNDICLGFLESNPGLGDRVGASGNDGPGCIAAMRTAAINEGPCNPTTGIPDPDPEREARYNLTDDQVPACGVLHFVDDPEISGSGWLPSGTVIPLTPGSMGMVTLLMSLGTVVWAVWAARNNVKGQTYAAIGITVMLGLAYANQIASLYSQMGLVLNETRQAVLIYAVTGGHLILVGVSLLFLVLTGIRAVGGQISGRDSEALSAAALFWFVTVGIFAVIWFTVLVTK